MEVWIDNDGTMTDTSVDFKWVYETGCKVPRYGIEKGGFFDQFCIRWAQIGKCKLERPQARWNDDLRKVAGNSWVRGAEDRLRWRAIGEAYVQQWTAIGWWWWCGSMTINPNSLASCDFFIWILTTFLRGNHQVFCKLIEVGFRSIFFQVS